MVLKRLMGVNDLPEGSGRVVPVGGQDVAVFRIGGKYYATENQCLHRGGPLGQGELRGQTVVCPWHGWRYDVATGSLELIPTLKVDTFRVEVNGEDVMIELDG